MHNRHRTEAHFNLLSWLVTFIAGIRVPRNQSLFSVGIRFEANNQDEMFFQWTAKTVKDDRLPQFQRSKDLLLIKCDVTANIRWPCSSGTIAVIFSRIGIKIINHCMKVSTATV